MSPTNRANLAVTAVLQVIAEALRRDLTLRAALVELLADEIDDAVRQAINDIRPLSEDE